MLQRLIPAAIFLCLISGNAFAETCKASWYGNEHHGRYTASGERFDQYGMTAAHRTLPFGTKVRVTYRGRSAIVRINDRGPARWTGKCIDLSRGAASRLGMIRAGVGTVRLEILN